MEAPVFLSYKRGDDVSARLLAALEATLPGSGLTPLIDRQFIQPGDPWRHRIRAHLLAARAGVVLCSAAALAEGSDWVPYEAAMLLFEQARREAEGRAMPVLLVRFPGVPSEALARGPLGPAAAREHQALSLPDTSDAGLAAAAATIAARLTACLGDPRATPRDTLEVWVTDALRRRQIEDTTARALLDQLGEPCPAATDARRALARVLLGTDLMAFGRAFEPVAGWLAGEGAGVLHRALPLAWVPPATATSLFRADRTPEPAVWTTGELVDLTPAHIVHAATPSPTLPVVDPLTAVDVGGGVADLEHELVAVLRQRLGRPGDDAAALRSRLALRASLGRPPLHVALRVPRASDAAPLVAAWPEVRFFVLADQPGGAVDGLRVLEPAIDPALEEAAALLRDDLLTLTAAQ